jgi:hypothetical protein
MEFTASHHSILGLFAVAAVAAVLVILLVFRMLRAAWPPVPDDVSAARLRRVCVCFILFACLVPAVLWALAQPPERREGASTMVGLFFAVPLVCLAGPVALYNSILLWRSTPVRALWIITFLVFVLMALAEERMGPFLSNVIALVYAVVIVALAVRGIVQSEA